MMSSRLTHFNEHKHAWDSSLSNDHSPVLELKHSTAVFHTIDLTIKEGGRFLPHYLFPLPSSKTNNLWNIPPFCLQVEADRSSTLQDNITRPLHLTMARLH